MRWHDGGARLDLLQPSGYEDGTHPSSTRPRALREEVAGPGGQTLGFL